MKNRKLNKILARVRAWKDRTENMTDRQLQEKTAEFKSRLQKGETLDSLLPEAYAVVCEADRRILGKFPYDVQILCAIALHQGLMAEMNTGEGKTLTATMPLYLNALTGKSCILVTANEYLAARDAEEMGPVYRFLGLTIAAGASEKADEPLTGEDKKKIYAADIVYTTHSTLAFDYLLNNLVTRAEDRYLRDFYYVIIDEADAVLLDAAQMPLVISGAPRVTSNLYQMADFFVTTLEEQVEYEQEDGTVWLTEAGVKKAEKFFRIDAYYSAEHFEINRHVTLALRAHVLFEKGKDYVVSDDGELLLLDNASGRTMPGMKLQGGIHQALEAREGVKISNEDRSMASITYQNLFLLFPKFAGMSGTIADARKELREIYKKKVMITPPNRPLLRRDLPDRFFADAKDQFDAAVNEILLRYEQEQPVLVVTATIMDAELISRVLIEHQVPHNVLSAKNAYWEAGIIAEAGQRNAVTVATGMAGRGTDIKLGEGVRELGGLAVIGVGRMATVREERQARGRAGRQGDPGISQFFVSLEDEVVESLGQKVLEKYVDNHHRISRRKLKRMINGAQKLSEEKASASRSDSVDYDRVMKAQRAMMYAARNRILDGMSLNRQMLLKLVDENIDAFLAAKEKITRNDISRYMLDNVTYCLDYYEMQIVNWNKKSIKMTLSVYEKRLLKKKMAAFSSEEEQEEFIRRCALSALDNAWLEQVDYLQQLQYVISGRVTAQRNLVFEFSREAYKSFYQMEEQLRRDICRNVFLGEAARNKKGEMVLQLP